MKLGFIGGGVMAEAMIAGILRQKTAAPGDVTASDILASRRDYLREQYGVKTVAQNEQALDGADVLVLAVKPQQLGEVLAGLKGKTPSGQFVLSIVAGAPIKVIAGRLGHQRIVRAMPNTPGQLGVGITAWTATAQVTEAQRKQAAAVLSALGPEVYLADEKLIDVATALSGSGPAYVFLFIEALTDAGVHLGMARETAHKLAVQTVVGSSTMVAQTGEHPAVLRNRVTSPGGTTAEALLVLENEGFRASIMKAVAAAYNKSVSLGKETSA